MGGGPASGMSPLVKRSFCLSQHRTSVALEPAFWAALERLASVRNEPLSRLVSGVDTGRDAGQPLASALRVVALEHRS